MSALAISVDCEEIDTLVYERLGGRVRGWRVELLVEQLTSKLEQKFLLCGCCSGLMRDACLLEKEGKQEVRCSVCIPEGVTWQPALMNREAIIEKLIRCPLRERGCGWTDSVSRGVQHLKKCGFLPVLCPLGCVESEGENSGELARVERRLVAEHERELCPQRELRCEFCGRGVRACEMNTHLGECQEFLVDCPNGCEAAGGTGIRQGKRGDVPLHLAECPLQIVRCPYWDYGCGEEMERRQIDRHEKESMHTHFKLAMEGMKRNETESTEQINSLKIQITELTNELRKLSENNVLRLTQTLTECNKLKSQLQEQDSNSLAANNRIHYLERLTADKDLEILSVKQDFNELKKTIPTSTGRLEWKIKRVKRRIETKQTSYSDPFNVGLYKCQGCIVWDSKNSSKLGCFICIMKGEYDDKLKWPFIFRYKFFLINQNRNEDDYLSSSEITKDILQDCPISFQRPTEIRNRGFGFASFISVADLLTEKYCREGTISFLITVDQLPPF